DVLGELVGRAPAAARARHARRPRARSARARISVDAAFRAPLCACAISLAPRKKALVTASIDSHSVLSSKTVRGATLQTYPGAPHGCSRFLESPQTQTGAT